MTRKDYIWLADHLRVARNKWPQSVVALTAMARDMADDLGRQNPRFDRAKFLEACGVAE